MAFYAPSSSKHSLDEFLGISDNRKRAHSDHESSSHVIVIPKIRKAKLWPLSTVD